MKHCFDAELATRYGVIAAVAFEHIAESMRHEGEYVERGGKRWVRFTETSIAKAMPYVHPVTVRDAIKVMRGDGLLETRKEIDGAAMYWTVSKTGREIWGKQIDARNDSSL
jgi:hypothetical protein